MKIGGIIKNSLIDYPGKISYVIFTRGCNFRCKYCHNKSLVILKYYESLISQKYVLGFLKKRIGQIEGVVLSGGEICLQKGLISFIRKIKKMNYLVKIDANGSFPNVLKKLIDLKLVDYIAMDIKGEETFINKETNQSIKLIIKSGVEYQFRTTVAIPVLSTEDIIVYGRYLKEMGAKNYKLQQCIINKDVINPDFFKGYEQYNQEEIEMMQKQVNKIMEVKNGN